MSTLHSPDRIGSSSPPPPFAPAVADSVLTRATRAFRRGPRYVVGRLAAPIARRAQQPWSRIYPRLLTERMLLRSVGASSIEQLWERLRRQPFLLDPSRRREYVALFDRAYGSRRTEILTAADRVLAHEFDLLGSGACALGAHLPWHEDFKSGRRWPLEYAPDIRYAELDRPTDVKVPWELSRCQHFTLLGEAFWLSGDERYAREFVDELADWIDRNPWGYGVNWACPMDVALRAVSWIWGFYFFAESEACASPSFRSALLRSLYLHGDYIASHLEKADVNGNHYLCDAVGLVFVGALFRDSPAGRRWLATGSEIVTTEIEQQVSEDGVDFEQSTAYHRLVLEAFTTSYQMLRLAGQTIPAGAWSRLERMCEYVAAYLKPNGMAPLIGDADDGRVQKLGTQAMNDHRYLLSIGAVLFQNGELKRAAGDLGDEAFWFVGPDGVSAFDRLDGAAHEPQSRAFPTGGMFVLRARDAHLIVDAAEVGMRGRGGHGHNDVLGFELWLGGRNLITDCGAYLYTASREWRNRFRSTAFHNVVSIDGEELNRFVGPDALWQLTYDAQPQHVRWRFGCELDYFTASHSGYARLAGSPVVQRELVLARSGVALVGCDTVTGTGTHRFEWRFHLDPDVRASVDGTVVRLDGGNPCSFALLGGDPARLRLETGWVSPSYGVRQQTTVIVADAEGAAPRSLTWAFLVGTPTAESCGAARDLLMRVRSVDHVQ